MFIELIRVFIFLGWITWLLIYSQGGSLIVAEILQALNTPRTRLDAPLLISINLDVLVVLAASGLVTLMVIPVAAPLASLSAAGAALALGGMWGTFYARKYLAPAWAAQAEANSGQMVFEAGPYSHIRHPVYTAAILMYAGLALVFPVWWNGLAVAAIVVGYVLKTLDEDHYLVESLLGYAEYAQRVRFRLVPMVW